MKTVRFKLFSSLTAICIFIGGLIYLRLSRPSYRSYLSSASHSIPAVLTEDQVLSKKIDQYKMCMNFYYPWILNLQQVYFSWCTKDNRCKDNGPSGNESRIFRGNFSIRDPKECIEKIAFVGTLKPHHPKLEQIAEQYAKSLQQLASLLNGNQNTQGLNTYYQNYMDKKDRGAFGKKQHNFLLLAWQQFFETSQILDENIDEAEDIIQKKQLDEQKVQGEKSGKKLSFLILELRYQAKLILNQSLSLKKKEASFFFTKMKSCKQTIDLLSSYQKKLPPKIKTRVQFIIEKGTLFLERATELESTISSRLPQAPQSKNLSLMIEHYVSLTQAVDELVLDNKKY